MERKKHGVERWDRQEQLLEGSCLTVWAGCIAQSQFKGEASPSFFEQQMMRPSNYLSIVPDFPLACFCVN